MSGQSKEYYVIEKYIICLGAGKHRNNQAQQVYTHHKKTQNVHEIYRK